MRPRQVGPRRSDSLDSFRRGTRILAGAALLVLIAGIISDALAASFWARHALLAGVIASVIVVMLSVAVVNEVVERRRRRRWSVLAQFAMFEMVRAARLIWTMVIELAGLVPASTPHARWVDEAGDAVRDTPRLDKAIRDLVADDARRHILHDEVVALAAYSEEMLAKWAGVMLNGDLYAEIVDRHVELAGDVSWLGDVLDNTEPPDDAARKRRARSSAAARGFEDRASEDWIAERVMMIAQLGAELDKATLEVALRIVPLAWWEERLGTPPTIADAGTRIGR
jgi:hypothetical protein